MPVACRHGSFHNAVKLVSPQTTRLVTLRSFSTTQWHPKAYHHDPESVPNNLLGSYTPNATPNPQAKNIAILGGGISGLAAAFNLSKDVPNAKIMIFESQEKLGGWMESEEVEVDGGTAIFEWGPRTLRPGTGGPGLATLQLMSQLGDDLIDQMVGVGLDDRAAVNRYIYYPDHLVRVPAPDPKRGILSNLFNNARTILTEPAFKGVIPSLFAEPTIACRPSNVRDESVGDFVRRRFGPAVADNLVSALFHGIYAGNIYKLSARTLLPAAWYLETRDQENSSGVIAEMMELTFRGHSLGLLSFAHYLNRFKKERLDNPESFNDLVAALRAASVYTFFTGLGGLKTSLIKALNKNPNVSMKSSSTVNSLEYDASNQKFSIADATGRASKNFDYTICTLSPNKLHDILNPADECKPLHTALTRNGRGFPSVNVMVVNLYYKSEELSHPPGFGYLIPRSVPAEQNPERALGVIFASETSGMKGASAIEYSYDDVDHVLETIDKKYGGKLSGSAEVKQFQQEMQPFVTERRRMGQDTAPGTKLAVMLGGHWWDGWRESDLPSEADGVEMAKSVIARHLGITEEPMLAKARMQRDCIPQYPVGYRDDMARIHKEIVGKTGFEGRLKVIGPWWQGGVGVNDCTKSAREMSRRIREGWDEETGLEDYVGDEKWTLLDKRTRMEVMDPMQKGGGRYP